MAEPTENPTIDLEKLSKELTEKIISQSEKLFTPIQKFNDLRDATADLKAHTETLAGMTENLTEKNNACLDEVRAIGGKNLPRRTDPEPVKKVRRAITLLELGKG